MRLGVRLLRRLTVESSCERSENIERCRVNVVSGQNFHFVENSAGVMST